MHIGTFRVQSFLQTGLTVPTKLLDPGYKYQSVNLPSHLGCEKWGKGSLTKHTPAAVRLASLTQASQVGRAVQLCSGG